MASGCTWQHAELYWRQLQQPWHRLELLLFDISPKLLMIFMIHVNIVMIFCFELLVKFNTVRGWIMLFLKNRYMLWYCQYLKIVDNISEKDSRWGLSPFDLKCKCTFSAFSVSEFFYFAALICTKHHRSSFLCTFRWTNIKQL